MDISKINAPWVLFELNGVAYAISSESVLSLNQISKITPIPMTTPEVRGVINFRDKIIQLLDTRILLNIKSMTEEIDGFCNIMDQRYQDHLNWITTLEKSIKENTEFTLTTDPHQCAFGKWYDSYELNNENIMFASAFAKFDKPHKKIHEIAIIAREMVNKDQKEEAIALINKVKETELKQMLHLFEEIKEAYKESLRETILVLGDEKQCVGIAVDKILAIEHLFEIDEEFIKESMTDTESLSGVAKDKKGLVILLLNEEFILNKYH